MTTIARPASPGLSVRMKIASIIGAVVLANVAFQVTYFPLQQRRLLTDAAELKATALGTLSAAQVAPGVEFDDATSVAEVLANLRRDPDVLFAAVYTANGAVFSQSGDAGAGGGRAIRATFPVQSKAGARGTLALSLDTDRIEQQASAIRGTTFALGGVILLLGVVIALIAGGAFGRRLERLTAVAASVSRGDLGVLPPADGGDDEIGQLSASFDTMLRHLRALEREVRAVAGGDLTVQTQERGDLANAFDAMIAAQRALVRQISDTALQLNLAAGNFLANAKLQERGAAEQSFAVEETRRTMERLHASSNEIAAAAADVLDSAERAQRNSDLVSARIATLTQHTQRIGEILEVIKGIANKSDLLALNAALEGTKAGEAGQGFSLVAAQMQRLAESVMRSVSDIKDLTGTVSEATRATVVATELSTTLAESTTKSARQIGVLSQQQQVGAEAATGAMHGISTVALDTTAGTREIVVSATDLITLSSRLQTLVGGFRVGAPSETGTGTATGTATTGTATGAEAERSS